MEAATLSSPQRKLNVVPVQKSLSLPSYAKAGGEGIDHRIIFAALEQREKVRRKSRIFAREKTARQNIFCLPISSGNKCRETSLSSDTSCSSLEYQKPKSSSKLKKEEKQVTVETSPHELSIAKTIQPEAKSNPSPENVVTKSVEVDLELQRNSLKIDHHKGHRSPSDTLRPNVNSSDSMERSSRSSNDSLSRKERLVAIKAKVEAAREKYGDTSSEDEHRSALPRYNSDGVIHRSVREVKSRSYRLEKRLRRRSQDEYALKKANRNNLSLCLNSLDDGIKLDLDRHLNIFEDSPNVECKTDFCPSPNFLDFTKKNYFSDFPSKENASRIVQTRIRLIEEEERKRRNSSDFRDKSKISSRQSPQNTENSSPFSTQRQNVFSNQNSLGNMDTEKNSPSSEALHCPSPVGRAPTPPPRSPKSITFVNKAYMQHRNTYLNHDSHSLERKPYFQPNIPVTAQSKLDKNISKNEMPVKDSRTSRDFFEDAAEKRKMKELFNSRRKTCGYFDYPDNFTFKELNSTAGKTTPPRSPVIGSHANVSQSKSTDAKGYFSGSETPTASGEDPKQRHWRSKWEETEKKHEFMFNSLESKKKAMYPSWMKSPAAAQNENCLCQIISGNKSICICKYSGKSTGSKVSVNSSTSNKSENSSKYSCANDSCQSSRLSKSEMNIAYSDQTKAKLPNLKPDNMLRDFPAINFKTSREKLQISEQSDKLSATANLDSAMEELENVYRSLKFSSDNLSEKNSASNLSLNDLNAETTKSSAFIQKSNNDFHFKSSSVKESNLNFHNKPNSVKPAADKKPLEFLKLSVYTPPLENKANAKSPETENLCIDELFNDLTRQLDNEQKLLRESRDNRSENRTSDQKIDQCDKRDQRRMTPLESIVSIRKELYDNLQKSSQDHLRSHSPISKSATQMEDSHLEMARKKCKAVRSLSENISYLMATANPNPVLVRKSATEKIEPSNCNMEAFVIENSAPKRYEHVALETLKIETKKGVPFNHPVAPKRTFTQKKPLAEEIRQIRVSMDSNPPESTAVLKRQYPEYPRLTSAVCRPQISPKNEASTRLPPSSNTSGISKDTVNMLDESGLEKLLNTLLSDVPEPKQSSLMLSQDDATSSAVSTSGEMRVMQHLDILRLKPIPS